MKPTGAPNHWIPIRDRVTGRLLCEYDPHTGRIRVRRNRRYYTAFVKALPAAGLPLATPVPSGRRPEETVVPQDPAEAAHQPCPEEADDRPESQGQELAPHAPQP
jgi:hypothetical protein